MDSLANGVTENAVHGDTVSSGRISTLLAEQRRQLLSLLTFVVLLTYGLIVDPDTGGRGIPCLWKALLGFSCPGCGLSRAGSLLLHGRLADAASMNWLIFPVVAVFTWKFLKEVRDFSQGLQRFRLSERSPRWQS